jgi:hypothetical protein
MKFVAVSTVLDPGAAEVAEEALGAAGIPVELKRLGRNPYLGSAGLEIEVRVPLDRLREAEAILGHIADEAEEAALRQSGARHRPGPDDDDDEPPPAAGPRWQVVGMVGIGLLLLLGGFWVLVQRFGPHTH